MKSTLRPLLLIALTLDPLEANAVWQTSIPPLEPPPPAAPDPSPAAPPPANQPAPAPAGQKPPSVYQTPPPARQPLRGSAAPPPPRTYGFLALPYVGVALHSETPPAGIDPVGPGLTVGALIGGRLNRSWSLNGELRVEFLNRQRLPEAFAQNNLVETEAALSPLFHHPYPSVEVVLGPKLGVYLLQEEIVYSDGPRVQPPAYGISFGGNMGLFFAVGRIMSLGAMFSFTLREPVTHCDGQPACNTYPEQVVALHAAALF